MGRKSKNNSNSSNTNTSTKTGSTNARPPKADQDVKYNNSTVGRNDVRDAVWSGEYYQPYDASTLNRDFSTKSVDTIMEHQGTGKTEYGIPYLGNSKKSAMSSFDYNGGVTDYIPKLESYDTGDAAIDELGFRSNEINSLITDNKKKVKKEKQDAQELTSYEDDEVIDDWLSTDRKLTPYEKKQAKKVLEDYDKLNVNTNFTDDEETKRKAEQMSALRDKVSNETKVYGSMAGVGGVDALMTLGDTQYKGWTNEDLANEIEIKKPTVTNEQSKRVAEIDKAIADLQSQLDKGSGATGDVGVDEAMGLLGQNTAQQSASIREQIENLTREKYITILGKQYDDTYGYKNRKANAQTQDPVGYMGAELGTMAAETAALQGILADTGYEDAIRTILSNRNAAIEAEEAANVALGDSTGVKIATDILKDMPVDILTDTIPELMSNKANGMTDTEASNQAIKNVLFNTVINAGAAGLSNADDIISSLKKSNVPEEITEQGVKEVEDAIKPNALDNVIPEQITKDVVNTPNETIVDKIRNKTISNKEIENILSDPQLKAEVENELGIKLQGTKSEQRSMLKEFNSSNGDMLTPEEVDALRNGLDETEDLATRYARTIGAEGDDSYISQIREDFNSGDTYYYRNALNQYINDNPDNLSPETLAENKLIRDALYDNAIIDANGNIKYGDITINNVDDAIRLRDNLINSSDVLSLGTEDRLNREESINALNRWIDNHTVKTKNNVPTPEEIAELEAEMSFDKPVNTSAIPEVENIPSEVISPQLDNISIPENALTDPINNAIDKSDELAINTGDKGVSRVYTNTFTKQRTANMKNRADQINAMYDVHHKDDVVNVATDRVTKDYDKWDNYYRSTEGRIDSDADVVSAMQIVQDKQEQINALTEAGEDASKITAEKQLLQLKLRAAGTDTSHELNAFKYWNHTPEGAVINTQRIMDKNAEKWAAKNKGAAEKVKTFSSHVTKDMSIDEIKATVKKDLGKVGKNFTDADVNYISNLINSGATKSEINSLVNVKLANGVWDVPEETVQKVTSLLEEANSYPINSKARVDAETKAFWELANTTTKGSSIADKLDAWRYLAMLGNPKTHMRNMIGNTLFQGMTGMSNTIAAAMEGTVDATSKAFGGNGIERTKAILTPADNKLVKACKNDSLTDSYRALSGGNKFKETLGSQISSQKEAFDSRFMRGINKFNSERLDAEDFKAMQNKYKTSLAGYLKANGLDETVFESQKQLDELKKLSNTRVLTEEEQALMKSLQDKSEVLEKGRSYAVKQAEYSAFHEDNAVADWLSKVSKDAPTPIRYLLEGVIPFKKTPANILKSGLEYSPLNVVNDIWRGVQVAKGNANASDFIEGLSKTFTGTAMVGLGAYLYDRDILNSSNDESKWQDQLEGIQNYSLTIGGKTFTIDFAAPFVMPLLLGAEVKKMYDANQVAIDNGEPKSFWEKLSDGLQAASTLASPIMETSMLSGINDTLETLSQNNVADALPTLAMSMGTGYLTQMIPTLLGQVTRTVDDTRRSTYSDEDNSLARIFDKQLTKVENKIPGLSKDNEPYVDVYGRQQNNNPFANGDTVHDLLTGFLYQGFSPSYIQDINTTDVDQELRRLYDSTKDPDVFFDLETSPKVDGERLSKEDYTTYTTEKGKNIIPDLRAMFETKEYQNADDETKATMVKDYESIVKNKGKESVVKGFDMSEKDKYNSAYKEGGIPSLVPELQSKYESKATTNLLETNGINENETTKKVIASEGEEGLNKLTTVQSAADKYGLEMDESLLNAYNDFGSEFNDYVDRSMRYGLGVNNYTSDVYYNMSGKGLEYYRDIMNNSNPIDRSQGNAAYKNMIPRMQNMDMTDEERGMIIFSLKDYNNGTKQYFKNIENDTDVKESCESIWDYYLDRYGVK